MASSRARQERKEKLMKKITRSGLRKMIQEVIKESNDPEVSKLKDIDMAVWDSMGARSGSQIDNNWQKYKKLIKTEVGKKFRKSKFGPNVKRSLNDENFHSLVDVLEELGYL